MALAAAAAQCLLPVAVLWDLRAPAGLSRQADLAERGSNSNSHVASRSVEQKQPSATMSPEEVSLASMRIRRYATALGVLMKFSGFIIPPPSVAPSSSPSSSVSATKSPVSIVGSNSDQSGVQGSTNTSTGTSGALQEGAKTSQQWPIAGSLDSQKINLTSSSPGDGLGALVALSSAGVTPVFVAAEETPSPSTSADFGSPRLDVAIMHELLQLTLDIRPPAHILVVCRPSLISPVLAPSLTMLGARGYHITLVVDDSCSDTATPANLHPLIRSSVPYILNYSSLPRPDHSGPIKLPPATTASMQFAAQAALHQMTSGGNNSGSPASSSAVSVTSDAEDGYSGVTPLSSYGDFSYGEYTSPTPSEVDSLDWQALGLTSDDDISSFFESYVFATLQRGPGGEYPAVLLSTLGTALKESRELASYVKRTGGLGEYFKRNAARYSVSRDGKQALEVRLLSGTSPPVNGPNAMPLNNEFASSQDSPLSGPESPNMRLPKAISSAIEHALKVLKRELFAPTEAVVQAKLKMLYPKMVVPWGEVIAVVAGNQRFVIMDSGETVDGDGQTQKLIFLAHDMYDGANPSKPRFDRFPRETWKRIEQMFRDMHPLERKGRYGFSICVRESGPPFFRQLPLGIVTELVQVALTKGWLRFHDGKVCTVGRRSLPRGPHASQRTSHRTQYVNKGGSLDRPPRVSEAEAMRRASYQSVPEDARDPAGMIWGHPFPVGVVPTVSGQFSSSNDALDHLDTDLGAQMESDRWHSMANAVLRESGELATDRAGQFSPSAGIPPFAPAVAMSQAWPSQVNGFW